MNIIIKESNRDRIQKEIDAIQKRTRERNIDVDDIFRAVHDIEERLGISKSAMTGVKASVDMNAQNFPNAYKWSPESTNFTMERVASGWKLVGIERDYCRRRGHDYRLVLTDTAKSAIIDSMTEFC